MKTIDIVGENYYGKWEKTRTACRGIIIDEYYENWKWVNKYFICKVIGSAELKQTERELEVGMVPRWLPIDEIIEIFSKYSSYADTDEMRRGMYLREYTALTELL